ncbi:hypothetical protein KL918_001625 [Ogataea parapolymorpha]|uniref:Specialized J-protein that functions with Hsp70 in Fe-S cluster biogenesis in mitochondria n=1 Tax=Ogataea parapolymorpha (strain ATCC 26012 / BCRC 20466 / JCM 22074 / NRRL Y-7560 / DL-1) TaxID=871575 RepID=W1QDA9_OGAPD|nr:Specialized J-protein that functions with Hsp70 in Fe-S cluster biogenesis in mitochondria [Ogataea parapolymorpha DL-1]ESW99444.1 Specialized J-protein that functions with Hsp70 in Fe-S cluster biogenesis in mitochondria [Ogataea parapolymorpha DL-1]KAG7868982.1 hypothetical protein KL918_001625 [Ogataea parapolymorpha]KAG7874063.1 hypothetical protein KL916_001837 [Ogataea parapolymorpha]
MHRVRAPFKITARHNSSLVDFYKLFPKTFPKGSPPNSPFSVDLKQLRNEFRLLQSTNHPDLNRIKDETAGDLSSLLNNAYTVLSSPLKRSQYLLKKNANIDLNNDAVNKKFQFQDQSVLMEILNVHEDLEDIQSEQELAKLEQENDERIEKSIAKLEELYKTEDYEAIALETVKLKFWENIKNALKEWEAGKPVNLTH